MITYSCDCCQRKLDSMEGLRYVVRIEVRATFDPVAIEDDDDRDHLLEIQEILERLEDAENHSIDDDIYQQLRFDLCPECRRKFCQNPLGRENHKVFEVSQN